MEQPDAAMSGKSASSPCLKICNPSASPLSKASQRARLHAQQGAEATWPREIGEGLPSSTQTHNLKPNSLGLMQEHASGICSAAAVFCRNASTCLPRSMDGDFFYKKYQWMEKEMNGWVG